MTFDPYDFGTVDTTGVASSRAAVQGAIDAAAAAGGGIGNAVVLPSGALRFDNSLDIVTSGITLVGEGYSTLLTVSGPVANKHVIRVRGTSGAPIAGVSLFGLRVQGHGDDSGVTSDRHGIYAQWCNGLHISDVWAHDCTFAALKIDDSEHATVSDFTVMAGSRGTTGGWYGIELGNFNKGAGAGGYSGHHTLSNITTHTPEHSIAVYLCDDVAIGNLTATGGQNDYALNWTGARRVVVNGFTLSTNGGGYIYTEADVTLGTGRTCADLTFANGTARGVVTAAAVQVRDLHGAYITSAPDTRLQNVVMDCSVQTGAVDGIHADANSPRLKVAGCNIVGPVRDGIRVNTDGAAITHTRVAGARGNNASAGAINLTAGTQHLVHGCRVEGSSGNGIYSNGSYTSLSDNIVSGCAIDGVVAAAADNLLRHNLSQSNTGWGFRTGASAARTRMTGNFAVTNTAGNYTLAGVTPYIDRNNRGITNDIAARSSSFTLTQLDYIVVVDAASAARTVTLPASTACLNGKTYVVKNRVGSANNVTIAAAGSDTIDGSATLVLTAGQSATVTTDGTSLWNAY